MSPFQEQKENIHTQSAFQLQWHHQSRFPDFIDILVIHMVFNMRFSYTHIITLIIFTPSPTTLSPTPADPCYLPICPPPSSISFIFFFDPTSFTRVVSRSIEGLYRTMSILTLAIPLNKKCLSLSQQLLTAHKFHEEAESCERLPSPLLDVSGSTQPDPVSL